jgi:preprotein translocase subunit YajC
MDFLISSAYAQTAGQTAQTGGAMFNLIFLGVMFAAIFFMMIRPQMKRAKEQRTMLSALSKGDEVVTSGGLLGKVDELGDSFITVEIANNVKIKLQKGAITAILPKGTLKSI